jgi:hypothetical protein
MVPLRRFGAGAHGMARGSHRPEGRARAIDGFTLEKIDQTLLLRMTPR